ncbi:MAG: TPMT family class I SAM-dependent methyltransferase [Saprospiraceae bacterium]|nr:TPMT family class I SAM-dependent methyltransferase [Saprospiraceae bacterium]
MLDQEYWENRWQNAETGWDAGSATSPFISYFETIQNKQLKVLIPGCGNAHEAAYLHEQGFENVYVCDWAKEPLANLKNRLPSFPSEHLIHANFFDLQEQDFDLILEQTFFCALTPDLRDAYCQKMAELLKEDGQLVGVLFNFPLTEKGPPFGGDKASYENHLKSYFSSISIEPCTTSIKPRLGHELWLEASL